MSPFYEFNLKKFVLLFKGTRFRKRCIFLSSNRFMFAQRTAFLAISPRFRSAPAPTEVCRHKTALTDTGPIETDTGPITTGKRLPAMSSTKLVSYNVKNHVPNIFYQFKWILFINIHYYKIKIFGMIFLTL